MTLRNKIFLAYTIIIIVPLLSIAIVVHYIFSTSKIEDVTENTENLLKQFNNNMDVLVKDASRVTLSILYNKELIDILNQYDKNNNYRKNQHLNTFSLFLSGITFDNEQVHGIHVFANNGQIFSHMDNYSVVTNVYLPAQTWYEVTKQAEGAWVLIPEESPHYYKDNQMKVISLARLIRDPSNKKELGVIKVDFSPDYISKLTDELGHENWRVTIKNEPLIKNDNHNRTVLKQCTKNQNWIKDVELNEEYLCIKNISGFTNIQVSNVIPKQFLYQEIIEFDRLLISLMILFLLMSLILAYFSANHLLKPLEVLKNQIKSIQNDERGVNAIHSKDELGLLSTAYNKMLAEIKELVEKIYRLNQRNAESEYKALQSRMDPHFLFNTLESINMTAVKKHQFELSDMITELAKLIRYRLKNTQQLVTLKDELDFSRTYLSLMKQRMMDKLHTGEFIEPHLIHKKIPKYIIQPLIENSLTHGKGEGQLFVFIKIVEEQGFIKIIVRDNGIGISEERQQQIYKQFEKSDKGVGKGNNVKGKGSGIALVNIYQRLQLIYGKDATFKINSMLNEGTIITIIIPMIKGELD